MEEGCATDKKVVSLFVPGTGLFSLFSVKSPDLQRYLAICWGISENNGAVHIQDAIFQVFVSIKGSFSDPFRNIMFESWSILFVCEILGCRGRTGPLSNEKGAIVRLVVLRITIINHIIIFSYSNTISFESQ